MDYRLAEQTRSYLMRKLQPFISAILASALDRQGAWSARTTIGPLVQTPAAYRDLSENPQAQAQAASYADLPWWQVFQDPQLQELIRTALKQNYDLQLATERINAGRAEVAITRSSLFPQVQGERQFRRWKRKQLPNQVQLSHADRRRGVPVGLLRQAAPRHRGVTRPTPCNRGRTADGDT